MSENTSSPPTTAKTFLLLFKRYVVFAEDNWAIRMWDLATRKMILEDFHYQKIVNSMEHVRHVPVVDAHRLEAIRELMELNRPFTVENGCKDWNAWSDWTLETFLNRFSDCKVHVSFSKGKLVKPKEDRTEEMPLGTFIRSFEKLTEVSERTQTPPPYLRAWDFRTDDTAKVLSNDYTPPEWATDYFDKMKEEDRPDFKWLFIGPKGVRTPLHIDPCLTHAWMGQIQGEKIWKFVPPSDISHLIDDHGFADLSNIDPVRFPTAGEAAVITTTLTPGQILFVPQGWAHDVTTTSHGIAVTHNFIDKTGYSKVVRHACLKQLLCPGT
eukprot:TRINITY_DN16500_c0_g1_i1.p1 TRINITY_DN16500_c0_g1~~TRINITY_DN16500_c0_g1_i1.p1  ORF type:complete len:342 (+),score=52.52 TRINITY_DN16500_c0_g1_i1:53-1027(+)